VYNLRYHIASLVAVFLALAVGLVLGTVVTESGLLKSQIQSTVAGLNTTYSDLRTQIRSLQARDDDLTSFASEAAPQISRDALTGRTVLIVADPDSAKAVADASNAIHAAGGQVAVATFESPGLSVSEAGRAQTAAEKALETTDASQITTQVATALGREWATAGDPRVLTQALVSSGGLRLSGLPSGTSVGGAAVTLAFDGEADPSAVVLLKAFDSSAVPRVGIEVSDRATGAAQAAVAAAFSGVDDVDSPLGQVSLVWVLAQRATGSFGVGPAAKAAFPTPLFVSQ